MNLEEKINIELKKAMFNKNKDRMDALRAIRSSIIEFNKSGTGEVLNEEAEIKMLNQHVKKRKDSIEMYEKANRPELKEKEEIEIKVIQEFLPTQLTDDEVREIVKNKIAELGVSDGSGAGKVMGPLMKELSGKADGKLVQKIVKEILG